MERLGIAQMNFSRKWLFSLSREKGAKCAPFFEFTCPNQPYDRSAGLGLVGTYAEMGRLSPPGLSNFDCPTKFIAIFYIHSK